MAYHNHHYPSQQQRPMMQQSSSSYHTTPMALQPGQLVRPHSYKQQQQYPPQHNMRPSSIHSHSYNATHSTSLDRPLPNPHSAGYTPSIPQYPSPVSPHVQSPTSPRQRSDTAEYEAALEASRSSAAQEEQQRKQLEEEETRRLRLAHEQDQREQAQRHREEEEELQRVLSQSRQQEEERQRRIKEDEERVLEESRLEAERVRREEEEEMKKVMEQSLREEWQRRKEAEMEEIRMVEVARREIEQRSLLEGQAVGSSRGPGTIQGHIQQQHQQQSSPPAENTAVKTTSGGGRRPLPRVPTHTDQPEYPNNLTEESPSEQPPHHDPHSLTQPDHNPFADSAEAPPDYDSVRSDQPPDAPSRAPTGFWTQPRHHDLSTVSSVAVVDPIEEKRRMEAAGSATGSRFHVANPSASGMPTREHTPRPQHNESRGSSAVESYVSGQATNGHQGRGDAPTDDHSQTNSEHTPSDSYSNSLRSEQLTTSDSTPPTSYTSHQEDTRPGVQRTLSSGTTGSASSQSLSTAAPAVGQSCPLGIDWGYSDEAFATELRPGPRHNYRGGMSSARARANSSAPSSPSGSALNDGSSVTEDDSSSSVSLGKDRFPHVITLLQEAWPQDSSVNASEAAGPYFTIRCGSWRLLLRTLAWLGNTQVEAGPNEVVDAANENRACSLKTEVEFVTPSIASTRRVSTSSLLAPEHYGGDQGKLTLDEIIRRAQMDGHGGEQVLSACVSVCISLSNSKSQSNSSTAAKDLDVWYLHRGSTRRIINLPPSSMGLSPVYSLHSQARAKSKTGNQGFILPCNLIDLANNLVSAHKFSASCPTSGSTARHTPRDLYHTIESHDEDFIKRLRKELHQPTSHRVKLSKLMFSHILPSTSILLWDPNPPSATNRSLTAQHSHLSLSGAEGGEAVDEMEDISQEVSDLHLHQRIKGKLKKKWRGRQGNVEDGLKLH